MYQGVQLNQARWFQEREYLRNSDQGSRLGCSTPKDADMPTQPEGQTRGAKMTLGREPYLRI